MTFVKVHLSFCNADTQGIEKQSFKTANVALFAAPSIDVEGRINQDSASVIELTDGSLILCISDGAGGHKGGDEASRLALELLHKKIEEAGDASELKGAILAAIDEANALILEIGAATTLLIAHVNREGVSFIHIGDSAALIVGSKGKLKFQTVAHSPIGYAYEAGLINEEEALTHQDRNIVSNMLGMDEMHVQVSSTLVLAARDTLLLASDGLFDNLRVEEITEIIRKGSLKKVSEKLRERIYQRMLHPLPGDPSKPDDVSFILCRLNSKT